MDLQLLKKPIPHTSVLAAAEAAEAGMALVEAVLQAEAEEVALMLIKATTVLVLNNVVIPLLEETVELQNLLQELEVRG